MPIVQSVFTPVHFTSGTANTFTASLGAAVTSGNTVLIGVGGEDGFISPKTPGSVTDNQSNSYLTAIFSAGFGFGGLGWFYLTNITNGPTSFSVPLSGTPSSQWNVLMAVYELSFLLPSPLDAAIRVQATAGTNVTIPLTTNAAPEMAFACLANNGSANSFTQNNGWTTDSSDLTGGVSYNAAFAHTSLVSSGSSNGINIIGSVSDLWEACYVSFKTVPLTASIAWVT